MSPSEFQVSQSRGKFHNPTDKLHNSIQVAQSVWEVSQSDREVSQSDIDHSVSLCRFSEIFSNHVCEHWAGKYELLDRGLIWVNYNWLALYVAALCAFASDEDHFEVHTSVIHVIPRSSAAFKRCPRASALRWCQEHQMRDWRWMVFYMGVSYNGGSQNNGFQY